MPNVRKLNEKDRKQQHSNVFLGVKIRPQLEFGEAISVVLPLGWTHLQPDVRASYITTWGPVMTSGRELTLLHLHCAPAPLLGTDHNHWEQSERHIWARLQSEPAPFLPFCPARFQEQACAAKNHSAPAGPSTLSCPPSSATNPDVYVFSSHLPMCN